MSRFLTYVVNEQLAGRGDAIKGYTLGLEVFDRGSEFNPELDSVVRVEAVRLRRALRSYYLTEGKDDPVIIDIPKGGYAPSLSFRDRPEAPPREPAGRQTPPDSTSRRGALSGRNPLLQTLVVLTLLLATAGAAFWLGGHYFTNRDRAAHLERQGVKAALSYPHGPAIAILPFSAVGMGDGLTIARSFHIQLISDLTRFKDLAVMGAATTAPYFGLIGDLQHIAAKYRARYILSGLIQREGGNFMVLAHLYDSIQGRFLWSHTFSRPYDVANIIEIQNAISGQLAASIGQPYGVINRTETRQIARANTRSLSSYQCVLSYYEYALDKHAEAHARVRKCLGDTLRREPEYSRAWALLSRVYADEVRHGFNPQIRDETPLELAREAAERAISLAPSDATGHLSLGTILFETGDWRGAREHVAVVLSLNPNDAELLAEAGWVYARMEMWETGRKLVEKARRLNPGHPPWYYATLFA
ncbi:MAG: hypothetical protein D6773_10400, partial [Alphaproteobacteria bacterium]